MALLHSKFYHYARASGLVGKEVLDGLLRESYDYVEKGKKLRDNSLDPTSCAEPFPALTSSPTSPQNESQQPEYQQNEVRLRYGKRVAIRNAEKITNTNSSTPPIDTPKAVDDLLAAVDGNTASKNSPRMTELDRCLAELLVNRGILNRWQTTQLLEGRTKFTLGNYLILNAIGKGGYGHVFLGRECEIDANKNKPILRKTDLRQTNLRQTDAAGNSLVALKVLPITKSTPELSERFRNEITLQKRLWHRNLVRFIDSGHDGNVDFMVHEFIDGGDVRALLQREGVLPYDTAAAIIADLARGVQYLHDQGIVHRDIKPANILISSNGEAKLIDLGLSVEFNCNNAKNETAKIENGNNFDKDVNKEVDKMNTSKIAGTVDYVAPDQICNPNEPVPAWDIYSIGCSFYQLLAGKVPFPKGDMKQKLTAHVNIDPIDPRILNQSIPFHIAEIALSMLAKDPTKRIKSANEIIEKLSPWIPPDGLAGQIIK
jgi:serine/threonine protein kinase